MRIHVLEHLKARLMPGNRERRDKYAGQYRKAQMAVQALCTAARPDGFRLYSAAQEVTGIKHLWEEFPYEDACGRFELADGRQLLRYLTAAYFQAVSWEIVPGTTYERAILQEVDTRTPEYRAFEKQIYEAALRRMGLRKTRASKSERGEAR